MTGAGAFVAQLRAALVDEIGDGKGSARLYAAFDRAACGLLGRIVDGGGTVQERPVTRRARRARRNGTTTLSDAEVAMTRGTGA